MNDPADSVTGDELEAAVNRLAKRIEEKAKAETAKAELPATIPSLEHLKKKLGEIDEVK
jgi:hypothetical protein